MILNIKLSNINSNEEISVQAIISVNDFTFSHTMNVLTHFFPSALYKGERSNLLSRQIPNSEAISTDIFTAFYNFKHMVVDKDKMDKLILGFQIYAFRSDCDTVQLYLAPPFTIN